MVWFTTQATIATLCSVQGMVWHSSLNNSKLAACRNQPPSLHNCTHPSTIHTTHGSQLQTGHEAVIPYFSLRNRHVNSSRWEFTSKVLSGQIFGGEGGGLLTRYLGMYVCRRVQLHLHPSCFEVCLLFQGYLLIMYHVVRLSSPTILHFI